MRIFYVEVSSLFLQLKLEFRIYRFYYRINLNGKADEYNALMESGTGRGFVDEERYDVEADDSAGATSSGASLPLAQPPALLQVGSEAHL